MTSFAIKTGNCILDLTISRPILILNTGMHMLHTKNMKYIFSFKVHS
jgi:hypothetical protein